MRKYFLYARKSTDTEDKQVLSIEAQLVELKMFLKTIQDACIVEEFIETRTAKEPGRPIFNKMLSRIEKGEAEGIISWHPDRLARNAVDGGKIIHLIDQNHVKYLDFPNYRFDNTPQGKFMLSIIFGQSKYYVDNLSENVKRGIRQKLRRGEWPGQAHLGYVNNLKTKKIDIEPNLGPKVKQLFETYSTGKYSLSSMISYATLIGLLSRVTNRPITKHAIQKMLSNPIYIGKIKYDGEIYNGTHEPLISEELYYKVQDVMKKKSRPIKAKHKFHFTRLIRCEICGSMITAETHKGFIYYRCVKKKAKCCSKYIRQELLVNQINKSFKKVLLSNILQKGLKNKVKEEKEIIKNDSQKELDLLNDSLKNVENQVSRLMDIYLEGEISKREYIKRKEKLIETQFKIRHQLNQLERGQYTWLERLEEFINGLDKIKIAIETDDLETKREFLEKIGSNFSLGLVGGGKNYPSAFSAPTTTLTENSKNVATATRKSMRLNYDYQNLWKIIAIENRRKSGKTEEEKLCNVWRSDGDSNPGPLA